MNGWNRMDDDLDTPADLGVAVQRALRRKKTG
jgi:hypothetical protein